MRIFLKIILTVILLPVAGYFGMMSHDLLISKHSLIDYSFKRDLEIYQNFLETSQIIDDHIKKHGKLPDEQYIENYTLIPQKWLGQQDSNWSQDPFFRKIQSRKTSNPNAYVLMMWRGEWSEYFASPSQETSVARSKSEYYVTGSRQLDGAIYGTTSLLMLLMLILGWRKISHMKFENA